MNYILTVKGYLRKGAILLALKEPVKAVQVYEKVLEMDPENLEAKEGIMKCHHSGPLSSEEVKQRAMRDPEILVCSWGKSYMVP
jgi:hypothetical protein